MKYLAVDYGQKRVGLALGDEITNFAYPNGLILRKTKEFFWREFIKILNQERPDAIILGLPLHQDGSECLATRQCLNFAAALKRRNGLPIFLINELLTSFEAEQDLNQVGLSPAKMKMALDQQAAVKIMQTFLAQPLTKRTPYV